MVSELVTNAVVHGAEPIRVTMVRAPERVRVEVTDGAAASSPHGNPRPPTDAETGRGLSVVTRLAVAWGWRASPGSGKTVWAELPLDAGELSAASRAGPSPGRSAAPRPGTACRATARTG